VRPVIEDTLLVLKSALGSRELVVDRPSYGESTTTIVSMPLSLLHIYAGFRKTKKRISFFFFSLFSCGGRAHGWFYETSTPVETLLLPYLKNGPLVWKPCFPAGLPCWQTYKLDVLCSCIYQMKNLRRSWLFGVAMMLL
jgi:hypothetical protein